MPAYVYMKILFTLLFPLFLSAHSFSLASYNVYNLFDATHQGSEYGDFGPGKWSQKDYESKLEKITRVLQDLDADIITLQEIENENVLLTLKKRLGYPYHAVLPKKGAAVTLGTLSRYKITQTKRVEVKGQKRGILKTVHNVATNPVTVYNNHWRSLNGPESHRRAYATALMHDIDPNGEYIISGDFNSNYDRYLYLRQNAAINETLQTMSKESLHRTTGLGPKQHYTLWLQLPCDKRFSYRYRGRNNTLDGIILPRTLFDKKGIDYVKSSFHVFKPNYLYRNGRINEAYSDHLPVIARFSTDGFTQETKTYDKTGIAGLYKKTTLHKPKLLQNAHVIFKDDYGVTLKRKNDRAIYLYDPGIDLKLGGVYDLLVCKLGSYHGLRQLQKVQVQTFHGKQAYRHLLLHPKGQDLNKERFGGEVLASISGTYKNGRLHYGPHSIDLYFQDKSKRVPEGSNVTIKYAKIAKYKGSLQLVVSKQSKVE
ncbi:MAG: endonuclease/exonuclease/phosphatase family protein [Campylobacterota bacterium]